MTRIKICGLSRPIDIDMVNSVLPDYIGFVFAKSRRQVTEETAKELKKMLNPTIQVVGVFVNEEKDKILRLCKDHIIDIIQLHGDEDENYIQELRNLIKNPIIKAVRVRSNQDIVEAEQLNCDYLLLDAYKENEYGGCGETFDWTMITKISKPFFLAGGIHSENVTNAIDLATPYCIDVSSGVETEGFKDRDKIIEIVTKVQNEIKLD